MGVTYWRRVIRVKSDAFCAQCAYYLGGRPEYRLKNVIKICSGW